jgi:hypothetical protein
LTLDSTVSDSSRNSLWVGQKNTCFFSLRSSYSLPVGIELTLTFMPVTSFSYDWYSFLRRVTTPDLIFSCLTTSADIWDYLNIRFGYWELFFNIDHREVIYKMSKYSTEYTSNPGFVVTSKRIQLINAVIAHIY